MTASLREYPENYLRGIVSPTQIDNDFVTSEVFLFASRDIRDDGLLAISINWQDDENAIEFTKQQRKSSNGELYFRGGVAVLDRSDLDDLIQKNPYCQNNLFYERAEIIDEPKNPYHGNLLLSETVPKRIRVAIANHIALHVKKIIQPAEC